MSTQHLIPIDGTNRYAIATVVVDPATGEPTSGSGGGGGSVSTAGLATSAKQDALRDTVVRESATTQNVLVQLANASPARMTSFSVADLFVVEAAHAGLAVGDQLARVQVNTVAETADPSMPYWTTPAGISWIRTFDAQSGQHVRETLVVPVDTSKTAQTVSALVIQTSFTRTVTRRALDAALDETLQDAVETRTVHASHIPPYPEVFDSGWV